MTAEPPEELTAEGLVAALSDLAERLRREQEQREVVIAAARLTGRMEVVEALIQQLASHPVDFTWDFVDAQMRKLESDTEQIKAEAVFTGIDLTELGGGDA